MDRDGREWNYQALLNLVVLLDKSVHRGGVLRLRLLVQRAKDLLRDGVHAVAWVRVDVLGRGLVAHLAGGRVGHVVRVAHQRVGAVDLGVDAVEVAKQVVKAAVLRRGQGGGSLNPSNERGGEGRRTSCIRTTKCLMVCPSEGDVVVASANSTHADTSRLPRIC